MDIGEATQRLTKIRGLPACIRIITDGLNVDAMGEPRDGSRYGYDHMAAIYGWMRLTHGITIRLQWFHRDQPDFVKERLSKVAEAAQATHCSISLSVKPFGQKYTPGATYNSDGTWSFVEPGPLHDRQHRELLGYWMECIDAALEAGVLCDYLLIDHPPNMEAWRPSKTMDEPGPAEHRWLTMLNMVGRGPAYLATDRTIVLPRAIPSGHPFGGVYPPDFYTWWLSFNGYNVADEDREFRALEQLVNRQRGEKLAWWLDVRRSAAYQWGRRFADRTVGSEFARRIDAVVIWPTIFSSPESTRGVVEFLEGLAGVKPG